jgi:ArsR family metal-binding transcriptional regulator
MLLKSYIKEIFRPECNPKFQSLHCIAHLDQDIGQVLPYLNAVLGGFEYLRDPPAVTFKVHGKLITIEPNQIAVNALRDEEEADKILEWLKREINNAWEKRKEITPKVETDPRPQPMEILKHLPRTNCRACGENTCMVFALRLCEEAKGLKDCPALSEDATRALEGYLHDFSFD